ncbi:EamA family transporter [Microbacterium sp.]|uniref:EamA family transporter n=1 Tax=Microbacterium sp. TaxID=51671 RepID=UPI003340BF20
MNNRILPVLLLTALAPIAWGTTYAVTTEFLPAGHPLFAALMRSLPAGLLALLLSRRLPRGAWWGKAAVLGVLNIGAFFPLLFLAAALLPGGVAAAVAGAQPLVVLLLSALVLQERAKAGAVVIAVLGAVGVGMVVLGPAASLGPIGVAAAISGTLATSFGIVLTKKWGRPEGVGPVGYAGWQLTAGGLVLLPAVLLFEGAPTSVSPTGVGGYLWLGTVGGLIAYTLWFRGIVRLPAFAVGLLSLLSPVTATLIGVLVLDETFTALQAAGLVLTLLALLSGQLLAMRSPGQAASPASPERAAREPVGA